MKREVLAWFLSAAALFAAEGAAGFSRSLSTGDFQAAGLAKLSAAERDRLDALVEAFRHGGEAARPASDPKSGTAVSAAPVREAKVVVAPGTKVEFAAVESRLAGKFSGWEPRGVFEFENGQRWREANGSGYATPPLDSPRVRVAPGALGSFWLEIEGVRTRVKVVRVDTGR